MSVENEIRGLLRSGVLSSNKGFFNQKIRLFCDDKKKESIYYTDTKGLSCEICGSELSRIIFFKAIFYNVPEIHFACKGCIGKVDTDISRSKFHELVGAAAYRRDTSELIQVYLKKPELGCRVSVFDIGKISDMYSSYLSHTVNNTRLAFNKSFNKMIDNKVIERELEWKRENDEYNDGDMTFNAFFKKDLIETEEEFDREFSHIDGEILIEHTEKKKIGYIEK